MPPEQVFTYYQSKTTPLLLLSSSFISARPKSHSFKLQDPLCSKCYSSMKLTRKNVIPVLVFVLSVASVIRLLKISVITASFSSFYYYPWSPGGSAALPPSRLALDRDDQQGGHLNSNNNMLSKKEMRFLSDLISKRAPCNILVFGLESQYSGLISMLNVGGFTLFLEDNDDKIMKATAAETMMMMSMNNSSRVQKVEYHTRAEDAYKLLKDARKNPQLCSPLASIRSNRSSNRRRSGRCILAKALLAMRLSQEVYETDWDVVVVDGPASGHQAEFPGRMATIYAAAVLARKIRTDEKAVDVAVHDVDRMIEKWFSWEFLCANNLVASKGRFWNFRIQPPSKYNNATTFC